MLPKAKIQRPPCRAESASSPELVLQEPVPFRVIKRGAQKKRRDEALDEREVARPRFMDAGHESVHHPERTAGAQHEVGGALSRTSRPP